MNCFDCKIPCEYSNPLGYCYKEQSGLPHGSFEKGYQPADAMKALDEKIKRVSEKGTWDGVDVDKYIAELRGRDTELQQVAKALVDAVQTPCAEGVARANGALDVALGQLQRGYNGELSVFVQAKARLGAMDDHTGAHALGHDLLHGLADVFYQ